MIKYIVTVICFSLLLQSCKSDQQQKISNTEKTEKSQSRYCFINGIKFENQKYILHFDQVDYKNDTTEIGHKIIEMPNGFFFSDNTKKIESNEFDSNSMIIMQTFSFAEDGNFNFNEVVKLTDFVKVFDDAPINRFKSLPFRLVSTGTKIDSLFEIYIP